MKTKIFLIICLLGLLYVPHAFAQNARNPLQRPRVRDCGIIIGVMQPGPRNAITDVQGVSVGQVSIVQGDSVRTGVTAILPHQGNIFRKKVPAAVYAGNGYGKLAGVTQIKELGNIETPVVLTNTLSIAAGLEALITYTLAQPGNEKVQSVNGVVGETNDGELNDIRGRHVKPEHVLKALDLAGQNLPVEEGNVGAGTGTVCFGYKGGIGTASRVLPPSLGAYTVGVLVQTNFGGVLQIAGKPVGKWLKHYSFREALEPRKPEAPSPVGNPDGSCMIIVITDAPVGERNLERLARRAFMGLARTGGIASNGSGDYVIALSVAPENLIDGDTPYYHPEYLHNDACSPLFLAAIEATEEAILNSLFAARTTKGYGGHTVEALPLERILPFFSVQNAVNF